MAKASEFRRARILGVISLTNRMTMLSMIVSAMRSSGRFAPTLKAMSAVMIAAKNAMALFTIVLPVRIVMSRRRGFVRRLETCELIRCCFLFESFSEKNAASAPEKKAERESSTTNNTISSAIFN